MRLQQRNALRPLICHRDLRPRITPGMGSGALVLGAITRAVTGRPCSWPAIGAPVAPAVNALEQLTHGAEHIATFRGPPHLPLEHLGERDPPLQHRPHVEAVHADDALGSTERLEPVG